MVDLPIHLEQQCDCACQGPDPVIVFPRNGERVLGTNKSKQRMRSSTVTRNCCDVAGDRREAQQVTGWDTSSNLGLSPVSCRTGFFESSCKNPITEGPWEDTLPWSWLQCLVQRLSR